MKTARLNRLFAPSGNCFDVAIDHGMFNKPPSWRHQHDQIHQTIAAAAPDAIQLPGTAKILPPSPTAPRWFCAPLSPICTPLPRTRSH